MNKKILVTGAGGQLGRSLVAGLSGSYSVIPTVHKKDRGLPFKVELLNITEPENVKDVMGVYSPDIVINCAAMTNVDLCENNHSDAWEINVTGLDNIIKFTRKDTLIIQISTDYVFDGENGPYSENDPTFPVNYYGRSKLAAENLLIGSQRKHLILRPNVLYSSDLSMKNFFSWVFWSLSENTEIQVVSDQTSNPTWTSMFSDVIRDCIMLNCEGIYHFGSENFLSRFDFALEIAHVFNFTSDLITDIKTNELDQLAKRPVNSGLITQKLEEETGVNILSTEHCLHKIKTTLSLK